MAIPLPRDSLLATLIKAREQGANPLDQLGTVVQNVSPALLLAHLSQEASRAAGGGVLAGIGQAGRSPTGRLIGEKMPVLNWLGQLGFDEAAQQAANAPVAGNPIERAQQANEAGARGHELQVGLLNAALDPSNLLPVLGKLGRAGELFTTLDRIQGAPFEGAGKVFATLARNRAAREAITTAGERATGKAGGLAATRIPKVGGIRQYGPVPPPPRSMLADLPAPEPPALTLPERALPDIQWRHYGPDDFADEGVTPGMLEAFARLRGADEPIAEGLGWSKSEADKLVSTAYGDVPKAIANARAARPDPIALTERAIERINGSEPLRARMWERDPDLAQRAGIEAVEAVAEEAPTPARVMPKINGVPAVRAKPVSAIAEEAAPTAPPGQKPTWAMTFRERMKAAFASPYDTPEEAAARARAIDTHADRVAAFEDLVNAGDKGALGAIPGSKLPASSRYEELYPEQYYASKYSGIVSSEAANLYDAHRRAVQAALEAGEDVPPEVLADFPMLQGSAPKQITPRGMIDTAAGGGMGILPVPGGLAGLERTLTGAAAGGVAGTIGGALAEADSPEERARNIALGASAGLVGGGSVGAASPEIGRIAQQAGQQVAQYAPRAGKRLEHTLLLDPEIRADVITAVQRARDNAVGNKGVRGPKEAWDAFWAYWRRQTVDTGKQIPQDAIYRATVMEGIARKEFGIDNTFVAEHFQRPVSRERATGAYDLRNPLNQVLVAIGRGDLIGQKGELVGSEFTDAVTSTGKNALNMPDTGKQFTRVGNAVAGALVGLGSGARTVNPIAPLYGAARGALDLEYSAGIRHLIGTANDSFREAMGWAGATRNLASDGMDFLGDLAARGVDVRPLERRGGLFSPAEVAQIAGKQAGDDWAVISEAAVRKAGDRAAYLAGDFRKSSETGAERVISKVVPFARWQIRATPVLLEVAARHPFAAIYAVRETQRLQDKAEREGKRAYQAGYTVTTETPVLGALARARLGGQRGEVTVDPIGAVVPYGEALGGGDEMPDDPTAYQRVTNLAGRIGFQPNPVIQSLAYVTGQDFKAPSNLSRTAGLEGLADVAPVLLRAGLNATGNTALADQVPDVALPSGRAILDQAREIVTGSGGGGSDPAERRYAELVLQATGKPLSDPSNAGYLESIGRPENGLWQLALVQARVGAAASNATGLVSPVTTVGQTTEARRAQAAGKLPFTDFEISQAPKSQQPAMRQAVARAIANNPAVATYRNISGTGREKALLEQWDRDHQGLKRISPSTWAERRKAYAASLR